MIDLSSYFSGGYDRGDGSFMRQCRAHEDRSASLSIKVGDNGAWMVKCFAGCSAEEVLASVGLTFADCYPDDLKPSHGARKSQHRLTHRDALRLLRREAFIVAIVAEQVLAHKPLIESDVDRVTVAARRITEVCEIAGVRDA